MFSRNAGIPGRPMPATLSSQKHLGQLCNNSNFDLLIGNGEGEFSFPYMEVGRDLFLYFFRSVVTMYGVWIC